MATDAQQQDAFARLQTGLEAWGLGALAPRLWGQVQAGEPDSAISRWIRDQPEYKQRFKGLIQRQKAGLAPMSEAEYIDYEAQAAQMMRAAGLPRGFYDHPDDFADLIGKDVGLRELEWRVEQGFLAARQAPAEVRAELQRLYGIDDRSLAAYFLDPDRAVPALQKQFTASRVSGSAVMAGFGELTRGEAQRLAELGVDADQAFRTFGSLTALREVFGVLPGEREGSVIDRRRQMGAAFGGDAEAREEIERKQQQRAARFAGAGGVAQSERGFTGLGEAGT